MANWLGIKDLADVPSPNPNKSDEAVVTFELVMDKGGNNQFGDNNTVKTNVLHQISQMLGEPMYDENSIITRSTVLGGEQNSKATSSLTPDNIAEQVNNADKETKKMILAKQLELTDAETKKKILEWVLKSLETEAEVNANLENPKVDVEEDQPEITTENFEPKESPNDDSVDSLLEDMMNNVATNNEGAKVVDKIEIDERSNDSSIPDLVFQKGRIKTKTKFQQDNNSSPSSKTSNLSKNSNSSKKSALGMVVEAARNLKNRFRLDNNQTKGDNNNMETNQIETLDNNPAEDQDTGTKRTRDDSNGPTTGTGEGDIERSNSNDQEQVNKIRKANEEAMEMC